MEGFALGTFSLILVVLLFLIFRQVTLWYFRINHMADTQNAILQELQRIGALIAPGEVIAKAEEIPRNDWRHPDFQKDHPDLPSSQMGGK